MNIVATHAPYDVIVAFNEINDEGELLYFTDDEIEIGKVSDNAI